MTTLAWVLGLSLALSFLCSILEAVLLSLTRSYVAVLVDQGHRTGRILARMQARIDEPIAVILTLNTIAHTMGASMGGAIALELWGDRWIAVFSAALTFAILIFTEIAPKTAGATFWQQLAPFTAYTLLILGWVMKPVTVPLNLLSRFITPRGPAGSTVSRAELEILAQIGRREGTLDEDEWQVVTNIMHLDDVTLGEVMTPRTDVVAVPVDATVEEAKTVMLEAGHLRVPVYEESLDHVVGFLLARDLWRADQEGIREVRGILRSPRFAPATKPVEEQIREMRRERVKMVIVLDEFGGTAGLATLEDLIEEIIGEIQDEHEEDEPQDFQELPGGVLRIWGGTSLRDVNERLETDLPEDDYDTIGGWVFGELNRVGMVGDEVAIPGGTLRVVRMKGRRIEYLRFTPDPTPSATLRKG